MTILVTGGAGYIGSHTVAEFREHGEQVVVIDNLRQGHRQAVLDAPLFEVDIRETAKVRQIVREHHVDSVVHFAANSLVGESVRKPLEYYDNNVAATAKLLSVLVEEGVSNIVFSSTAAVYGDPASTPTREDDPTVPTNPYGETKLAIERMLRWCFQAHGLKSISLRYFNAAGAHPELSIGEDHQPETHLMPIVLQAALGQLSHVSVFGHDYPTPDGTCVRDYVHVMDLASAHRLAVDRLRTGGDCEAFNLGNGAGFSVKQVIEAARKITGRDISVVDGPRRAGDPAILVASSKKAREVLGWVPAYEDLESIVASAWQWHFNHPNGYGD